MRPEPTHTAHEYAILFQQGDESALAFYYKQFYPALSLYAYQYVKDRALAEEIASDAFVKTWQKHARLDKYFSIRAYLYKTAQRCCIDAIRASRRNSVNASQFQVDEKLDDTPFDHLLRAEVCRNIHEALRHLPPGSRRVITMYYLEGKTTSQIASELNLHPNTIKTQKLRGLQALRKKFLRPMFIPAILILKYFLPFL